jgi:SulP family sulfate permease
MQLLEGDRLWIMIGLVVLTMAIIAFLPRFTKVIPSSLAAILLVSLIAVGMNRYAADAGSSADLDSITVNTNRDQPVLTVRDMIVDSTRAAAVISAQHEKDKAILAVAQSELPANVQADQIGEGPISPLTEQEKTDAMASVDVATVGIAGGLPRFAWLDFQLPPLAWATFWIILPYSLILASVGLIESLMTMTLIDELTETRGRGNRECVGQGVANVACGVFGGMGGCAMIGQSLINVKSGGRGRLSGVTAAIALLLFILFLAPYIEAVPMAALVGVMFMVVIGTFEWTTLQTWHRIPRSEVLVMIIVAAYTVFMHDLATAVIIGVALSAVVFVWKKSKHIVADVKINEYGSKIYQLHGVLFFGTTPEFRELFVPKDDPDDVVIDFYFSRVYDQSGLEAINALAERYTKLGKRLHLRHLSADCQKLLDKAGKLVEVNISEDPHYHIATNKSS